jgi:hypothetical protein
MGSVVPVDGRIESADDGVLRGWAWRADSAEAIRLAVTVDGDLLATVVADQPRGDFILGPGEPPVRGFELILPDGLIESGDRRIGVQVLPEAAPLTAEDDFLGATPDGVWCTTAFTVDQSPPAVRDLPETVGSEPDLRAADAEPRIMALESVFHGEVVGWARSRQRPHVGVAVIQDGHELVRGRADIVRGDLRKKFFGFALSLRELSDDSGPHAVSVEVGGHEIAIRPGDLKPLTVPHGARPGPDLRFRCRDDAGSGSVGRALLGQDGWLFPTREDRTVRWDKALKPIAVSGFMELVERWRKVAEDMRIPYVLGILPARERLEVEHLPSGVPRPRPGPAAQLLPLLPQVVDLRRPLARAKASGAVSWRTDPDLTPHGAREVTRVLSATAASADARLPRLRGTVRLHPTPGVRGRFAGRVMVVPDADGLRELEVEEAPLDAFGEIVALPDVRALSAAISPGGHHLARLANRATVLAGVGSHDREARAVLVQQGPSASTGPWLAETYGQVTVMDSLEFPPTEIEIESPDVIFHLIDEADIRLLV